MKCNIILFYFLFLFQIVFSQTGTLLHGVVTNNENPIPQTEVINLTTKSITHTNQQGQFSINVSPKDVLVFVSKNYETKKIYLGQHLDKSEVNIVMTHLKEQLKEVVVTSKTQPQFDSQQIVDTQYFDDAQSSPKNRDIKDGNIENGVDFVRLYKDIVKAFRKNKDQKTVAFKDRMLNDYDSEFFSKTLDIKKEEIVPFIAYCESDPLSKNITENSNTLEVLDFLLAKKDEFKKSRP